MQRYDFFFRQKVEEGELDAAFQAVEDAINRGFTDLDTTGIVAGLDVVQQVSPNLTVQVQGPGVAYDQTGQRIAIAATQNVNCAVDENALSTAVIGIGNKKWLSIFIEFDRTLSNPRLDGNASTVYYDRAESFVLNVAAGAEAVSPTRPALRSDQILLADVLIAYGQTTIVNGDISTTRREEAFVVTDTPRSILARTALAAMTQLLGYYNDHVLGSADNHPATAIAYAGGAAWADGATNPATTVEAQLDKIVSDLAAATGAKKLGLEALAAWADGATNPAGTLHAFLSSMVTRLAATTTSDSGAQKVGIDALGNWANGTTNPSGTLRAVVAKVVADLASIGSDSGAHKIGINALSNWADSTASVAAGTLRAGIDKIVTDLAASTGTAKVGGASMTSSSLSIAAGTLAAQLVAMLGLVDATYAAIVPNLGTATVVATGSGYTSIDSGLTTALAVGGGGSILYSVDEGSTWATTTAGSDTFYRVRYGASDSLYIAVGNAGKIYTAAEATPGTLTSRSSGVVNALYDLMVGGPIRYIAGGASGNVTTSPDGINWTSRTFGSANTINSIGGSATLAVATDGNNVRTSPDGINWTSRTLTGSAGANFCSYCSASGLYIVGCTGASTTGRIFTSPDGVTWTLRASPTKLVYSLAVNGSTVVATCADGVINYSTDGGATWAVASVPAVVTTGMHLRRLVYDAARGAFYAAGDYGVALTSADGKKWVLNRAIGRSSSVLTEDLRYSSTSRKTYGICMMETKTAILSAA